MFCLKLGIKGDFAAGGKDSIGYTGLVNLNGSTPAELVGQAVTLQIGQYTSPSVTLVGGKKGVVGTQPGSPQMIASVGPDGTVKISISKESLDDNIITQGQALGQGVALPVLVTIGSKFESGELLKFTGKVTPKGSYNLGYKFGPGNLGGGFLITKVTGKDGTDSLNEAGDNWMVTFLMLIPEALQASSASAASATVAIGTDFIDQVSVSASKNGFTAKGDALIQKLALNTTKGVGQLQTGTLPTSSTLANVSTGISAAVNAKGTSDRFALEVTFDDNTQPTPKELVGGVNARTIEPNSKGNGWQNQ